MWDLITFVYLAQITYQERNVSGVSVMNILNCVSETYQIEKKYRESFPI